LKQLHGYLNFNLGKENIFIHIPKTGGTTINTSMQNTYWANEPNFHYRHILLKEKRSNSGDIFLPSNCEKYSNYNIFMMVRDPVDRLISEYYFLRERKNFMDLLKKKPRDFNDYILNPQTQNYTIGFLVGKRIFDISPTNENDLDRVLDSIEDIPIHVGIFEQFEKSLSYFEHITGIKWKNKMEVKRMTFNRPNKETISPETKQLIIDNNQLDTELYEFCMDLFQNKTQSIKQRNITFIKDKYNHVIPYSAGTCLFEFCMENKHFLKLNLPFFKELTFYLLKNLKITSGVRFVSVWNATFIKAIRTHFPDSTLLNELESTYFINSEPLEQILEIAKKTDKLLEDPVIQKLVFSQPMVFNPNLIVEPKESFKGFINRLFRS